ncbi:hypothetical protein Vafri_1006 [Volvox africanus]|nr:hypothetical protein Vafri_1006 [Volvox africanus]
MVLVLPSVGPLDNTDDAVTQLIQDPLIKDANTRFLERTGSLPVPASCRAACALLGEQALVDFSQEHWHVGSSDATTCLIAVVVCHTTCKAWAAHYNSGFAERDTSILDLLPRHMQKPDLWLVGSFREPTGESAATLAAVLRQLQDCKLLFNVRLACVDLNNTDSTGAPCALSLVVHCSAVEGVEGVDPSPAGFDDRGPELPRRFAHDHIAAGSSCGNTRALRHIVDTKTSRLCISGFLCRRLFPPFLRYLTEQLETPDAVFLQRSSTSPDHEPPNFVEDVKAAYRFIIKLDEEGKVGVADAWFEWGVDVVTDKDENEDNIRYTWCAVPGCDVRLR